MTTSREARRPGVRLATLQARRVSLTEQMITEEKRMMAGQATINSVAAIRLVLGQVEQDINDLLKENGNG